DVVGSYPGTMAVTVFAGAPARYPHEPTPWDAAGGFQAGDDVAALRRKEDEAAMAVLDARPRWLDFVDHQYLPVAERPRPEDVAPVLAHLVEQLSPTAVFAPMGLANPDHGVTHDAALLVRQRMSSSDGAPAWFAYQDAGYCHIPGILAWRVSKLFRSGLWPTPAVVPVHPDPARKRQAISCYRSQLPPLRAEHALDERLAANVPEQLWRLEPPPEGWEPLADVP
ncbi:MAG TPA: PIG-L family deacetylase, partial [Acidimicrobiales bacterium]|nr:PIG-L family deacetylase [Acidimicrobiales bacterium]